MTNTLIPDATATSDYCSHIIATMTEHCLKNVWLLGPENIEYEDLQHIKNYLEKNKAIKATLSNIDAIEKNSMGNNEEIHHNQPQHYSLCMIFCSNEMLQQPTIQNNIACIRNLYSNTISIFSITEKHKTGVKKIKSINNQILALGFSKAKHFEKLTKHIQCYNYSIQKYNKKREWNNTKNWANPNNFDRFRW